MPFEVPPENPPSGYLLVGDSGVTTGHETVIATIPDDIPIELYFEQHDPHDRALLMTVSLCLRVHWVQRGDTTTLAAAWENRDWSDWYMWAGPETGTLKEVRNAPRSSASRTAETYTHGYWAQGKAMGRERDPQAEGELTTAAPPSRQSNPRVTASAADPAVQGRWGRRGRRTAAGAAEGHADRRRPAAGHGHTAAAGPIRPAGRAGPADSHQRAHRATVVRRDLGADPLGAGLLLQSALTVWLHTVDARFSRNLRRELLAKLARLCWGGSTGRSSGNVKTLIADNTASLHYLVTHAVMGRRRGGRRTGRRPGLLVHLRLAHRPVPLHPVVFYIVTMWRMMAQSGSKIPQAQSGRSPERRGGHLPRRAAGHPHLRRDHGVSLPPHPRGLAEFLKGWQGPFIKAKTRWTRSPAHHLPVAGSWRWARGSWSPTASTPSTLLPFLFSARPSARACSASATESVASAPGTPSPRATSRTCSKSRSWSSHRTRSIRGRCRRRVPATSPSATASTTRWCAMSPLHLRPGTVTALVGPVGFGQVHAGLATRPLLRRRLRLDQYRWRRPAVDADRRVVPAPGFVLQQSQLVNGTVARTSRLQCRGDAGADHRSRPRGQHRQADRADAPGLRHRWAPMPRSRAANCNDSPSPGRSRRCPDPGARRGDPHSPTSRSTSCNSR